MVRVEMHRFSDATALAFGLEKLGEGGLGPRGLVSLAVDGAGTVWLGAVEKAREAHRLRVAEKLALPWTGPEGLFHFDAVHCVRAGHVLFAGDRRLLHPGGSEDVAGAVSVMLRAAGVRSAFFGCRPHAPGLWLASRHGTSALHEAGYEGAVVVDEDLALVRKFMDPHLHLVRFLEPGLPVQIVFDSPLGNILFVERRLRGDRLILSCQEGLVEVDTSELPLVREVERLATDGQIAVVGRLEEAAFALTRGRPVAWGLGDLQPITLLRVREPTLAALGVEIERHWF